MSGHGETETDTKHSQKGIQDLNPNLEQWD